MPSGLRGFTRALYNRLDLRCEGMEFATEMIIKASLHGARISEIPITLYPDGRKTKLHTSARFAMVGASCGFSDLQPALPLSGSGLVS